MEKRRKITANVINGEFQLPEVIIQRIQSFLTGKEAAETTILSKSWNKSWLTRPNLDFDECDFEKIQRSGSFRKMGFAENSFPIHRFYLFPELDEFSKFAKKNIKRYEELKLKIESLSLSAGETVRAFDFDIGEELIVKALKMGATRLNLQIHDSYYVLLNEVFEYENLVQLSVEGCKIELGMDQKIRCSRLESLSLSGVNNDVISNIISSCPMIKNMSLCHIITSCRQTQSFRSLPKLTCLDLSSMEIDSWCFDDLSTKFPSLKNLTISYCSVSKGIQVSSRSLERLNFRQVYFKSKTFTVQLDAPSIRRLSYDGSDIPPLSFISTSTEWESHISIRNNNVSTSWFSELDKFFTKLSVSNINLSLIVRLKECFDYELRDIQCSVKHEVENLTIEWDHLPSLNCYALFDGLFRLCRPKFITQIWHDSKSPSNDFLCKRLEQAMNGNCSTPCQFMYGLNDLEEVNVEIFEESVTEWRSLSLQSLLDVSVSPKHRQKVRFQLKWRP